MEADQNALLKILDRLIVGRVRLGHFGMGFQECAGSAGIEAAQLEPEPRVVIRRPLLEVDSLSNIEYADSIRRHAHEIKSGHTIDDPRKLALVFSRYEWMVDRRST